MALFFFRNYLVEKAKNFEPPSPAKGFNLLSFRPESWGSCDVEHMSVLCRHCQVGSRRS